ncbi:hypothetical protein E3O25_16240 [Cryobacterium sp. TMT1-3]|uniref:Uncharacterized protein n=1 Tax=Cryobacterium luteum TaxID=1424661 RepID=A0A1H8AYY0_9MICO|nr:MULTISPECIES: hypothetical protein [Cryobacterium]TFB88679.1 hypothetical protein E3O10_13005 [Cryobacterium luteum]TFC24683.1 hypothetical protein E3O25_16240 [Cryobacterium sp. TMT1-3]SEM75706.1 hypothetical protein SAMN05216281_101385 [Cryobacterium luteum]
MDTVVLIMAALVLAVLGIRLIYDARAEPRKRMLQAYSRQVGLALVPEIVSELSSRIYRRERAGIVGSMVGLLLGVAALLVTDGSQSPWNGLLVVVAMTVGSTVALSGNDSRSAFAPVADAPRLARSVSPGLADYVTPLDRAFSLGLLGLATLGYIAVLGVIAINPDRVFDDVSVRTILWPAGLLLAIATAASLVTWAAANALLGRGQPAETYTQLAWSDAFRSTTLRSLVGIPGIIAAVSSCVLFLSLSEAIDRPTPGSIGEILIGSFTIMGPVLVVVLTSWSLTSLRNRSTTHFLRRLWPETAVELDRRRARGAAGDDQPGERPDQGSRTKTPA